MNGGVDFIAHYGVKGMRWGVHRDGSVASVTTKNSKRARPATNVEARQTPGKFVRTKGGKRQIASEDAVRVAAARQLAKRSTTDALSNDQLKEAVTRMNLEQQYASLVKKTDRRTRGQRFVQSIIRNRETIKEQGPEVIARIKRVAESMPK